ncbi:MAG TPA: Do family serine endopeptidase [Thermoguttaceae bacterium]|nr:Do family serine endopeptidase [Thermoguttaceae bacterium]HPP52711.1 Do family serine endopeptidase [Thermoguttaceae bacterium]
MRLKALPKTPKAWGGVLGTLGFVGLLVWGLVGWHHAGAEPTGLALQAPSAREGSNYAESLSRAFREAAEKSLPAVVMIRTLPAEQPPARRRMPPDMGEELPFDDEEGPFGDLFRMHPELRRFFRDMPQTPMIPQPMPEGVGSGVIIDPAGLILTNNHVVREAGKILVRLHDGREFEAKEVKRDPKTDLAIVRIEAKNLPAAPLGDSEKVQVGDWVLALGQPFGLEGTVTAGIISAKGRGLGIAPRENFLQTDAAINPGNSGGPLVNLNGEVVGINTAITTRSGGYQGVGFAVPINLAKWVAHQLIQKGKVERAYLGVAIQMLTPPLAEQFGLQVQEGVVVTDVFPNTPGEAAGLKPGDVILEFAGTKVSKPAELQEIVERCPINSQQTMTVLRDGKRIPLQVTVREQPEEFGLTRGRLRTPGPGPDRGGSVEDLGLQLEPLRPEVARQLGLDFTEGLVITQVHPNSVAALAGLETGEVIVQVNRLPVKTMEDFRKALEKSPLDKGVLLLVRTARGARFVVLKSASGAR